MEESFARLCSVLSCERGAVLGGEVVKVMEGWAEGDGDKATLK